MRSLPHVPHRMVASDETCRKNYDGVVEGREVSGILKSGGVSITRNGKKRIEKSKIISARLTQS